MAVLIGKNWAFRRILADWKDRIRGGQWALSDIGNGTVATVVPEEFLYTHLARVYLDFEDVFVVALSPDPFPNPNYSELSG